MHSGRWYGVTLLICFIQSFLTVHACILLHFSGYIFVLASYSASTLFKCFCSLGKTLQSITLLYTLLHQGFDGKPMVKKAIIVTPTSLVSNWEAEIKKWTGERLPLIALCESTREDVVSGIEQFTNIYSASQVSFKNIETTIVCLFVRWTWSWYILRCLLFHMRHSGCIPQNLAIAHPVTSSYVMRLTGWKMTRQ